MREESTEKARHGHAAPWFLDTARAPSDHRVMTTTFGSRRVIDATYDEALGRVTEALAEAVKGVKGKLGRALEKVA